MTIAQMIAALRDKPEGDGRNFGNVGEGMAYLERVEAHKAEWIEQQMALNYG